MKPPKKPKCLVPDCGRPVYIRGLCPPCYYAARALVAGGQVTWLQLETAKRAKPRQRPMWGTVKTWLLHDLPPDQVLCHCGKPLHYTDPQTEAAMHRIVAEHGTDIPVACNGSVYSVPRHYIALHGLIATDLPTLGFKKLK